MRVHQEQELRHTDKVRATRADADSAISRLSLRFNNQSTTAAESLHDGEDGRSKSFGSTPLDK